MDLLQIGSGKPVVWVIARQHPNEPQGEFWMEGFLRRLLDKNDGVACKLREEATFYVVPNMNPDGAIRGHLRTNACGANLNREWASTGDYEAPTLQRSPEVYHVLREVDAAGCDLFIDVHGDEEMPYNFIAGTQGIANYTPRLAHLLRVLCEAYVGASPFFQVGRGYDNDDPGKANLAICGDQIATRFDCLAATVEMPYKDLAEDPEPNNEGWNPERCGRLGAAMLDAIRAVLPLLRADINEGALAELPAWTQPSYKNPSWDEPTYPFAENQTQ
jgi:murein tripeptide amidase MpaA